MNAIRRLTTVSPIAAAAVLLLACGSDPLAPFQPEINNAPDNFQFQATGLTGVTTTAQYAWQNTGTQATVNHSSTVTGGSATLTIKDANGTQVYTGALVASGNPTTSAGVAGAWTISVQLSNTRGTLNFRVQKL
ncbi:MAG TPA: hypothetical protein VFU41_04480 [Gemmatimonadales bacterium]|nr:hypothetical protein [Gemmatimonadales bacterium]